MDYGGNTDKSKEVKKPDKQIEKVVTGEVSQKPKGIGYKFKSIFLGGDLKTASRYIAADVFLPALRNLLFDIVTKGTDRIIFGDSRYSRRPPEYRATVQYNNPIRRDPRSQPFLPDQPHPNRAMRRESNDIILASREEADRVVAQMIDILDQYEAVSWADLCALVGWPSSPVDNKWGWTYLTNTEIRSTRNGFLIDLPPMEAL
jgi:hypothetical protein